MASTRPARRRHHRRRAAADPRRAGSGKTRVIAHRIAYLVGEVGVAPWRIMAVTFTNKAARELRDRVETPCWAASRTSVTLGTFHAVCARILRIDGEAIGVPRTLRDLRRRATRWR